MGTKDLRVRGVTLFSLALLAAGCVGDDDPAALEPRVPGSEVGPGSVDELSGSPRGSARVEGFDIGISIVGPDVVVDWAPPAEGVEVSVWSSHDPYFTPGDTDSVVRLDHGTGSSFADPVVGDGVHRYYRVIVHDPLGDEVSTTVGKYAQLIYSGYNKIAQPLETESADAAALHAELGGTASTIVSWNAYGQQWQSWWPGAPAPAFTYEPGYVPIAVVGGGHWGEVFEQVGYVPADDELVVPISPGHNVVTMPLSYGDTTASELLQEASFASRVGYWDPQTQTQVWYYDATGPDFPVEAGQDVYVTATTAAVWPPDLPQDPWGPATNPLHGLGPVQLVAGGYQFTEGAVWHPGEQALVFSDLQADTLHRWDPVAGATQIRGAIDAHTNGMTIEPSGDRIECQHETQQVVRVLADGTEQVVVDSWQGTTLNSPNDVIVGADGTLYFSDATIGAYPQFGDVQDMPLGFQGVYRVDPGGQLHLVDDVFADPTGIALSPDGSTLYVSDWTSGLLHAYDVAADGSTGPGAVLSDQVPQADGMCIDVMGNIYVSMGWGLQVLRPDGSPWGTIPVPQVPANCAFGGVDRQTLFITARTGVYSIDATIPGAPLSGY
ncbi:MAG: SMP-30/gluconolactonase/LRE family protein [Nannocystaceae bacterium]